MRWIRLEVAFDESWLFPLSPASQLAWVKLLCTCKRDGVRGVMKILPAKVAARKWGVGEEDVEKMYRAAQEDGALAITEDDMTVVNWLEYNPLDRTALDRQHRHRDKESVTVGNGVSQPVTQRNGVTQRDIVTKRDDLSRDMVPNMVTNSTTTTKTTTSGKPEREKPEKAKPWVSEGHSWWLENVGAITPPRFATSLSPTVSQYGWPKVFLALKAYVEDSRHRGKPCKPEWCAAEIVRWVEWATMPATDSNGDLTPRGKAILGQSHG